MTEEELTEIKGLILKELIETHLPTSFKNVLSKNIYIRLDELFSKPTPAKLANLAARDILVTKIRKVLADEYLLCSGSLEDVYETIRRLAETCSLKQLYGNTPEKPPTSYKEAFERSDNKIREKLNKSVANDKQIGGQHYATKTIQPWDYILANNLGFLEGNAIKYITRHESKNGIEDINKAIHYLEKLIETLRTASKERISKDNANHIGLTS